MHQSADVQEASVPKQLARGVVRGKWFSRDLTFLIAIQKE
jgi:hypothetical protein